MTFKIGDKLEEKVILSKDDNSFPLTPENMQSEIIEAINILSTSMHIELNNITLIMKILDSVTNRIAKIEGKMNHEI